MKLTAGLQVQNGKYQINQVTSKSGWGLTLQGTQVQGNRPVSLQTLQPRLRSRADFGDMKQRFHEQIARFRQCQHPAIAHLLDTFDEDQLPFAVMEVPPGEALAEVVQRHGPLPAAQAVHYIQQVGSALVALHEQGVTHRQVTPSTIIRPPNSEIVVLTQFGATDPAVLGTVEPDYSPLAGEYAASELYAPQWPITSTSDVYAIAGTLYFLITGHAPPAASLRTKQRLLSPSHYVPTLQPELATVILRGLELDPKLRLHTVSDWLSQVAAATRAIAPASSVAQLATASVGAVPLASVAPDNPPLPTPSGPAPLAAAAIAPPTSPIAATEPPVYHSATVSPSKRFAATVLSVSLVAAAIGGGSGLLLRLAASSTGPGRSFFHSEQAFPPLNDWPREAPPVEPAAPYAAPAESYRPEQAPQERSPQPDYIAPAEPAPAAPTRDEVPEPTNEAPAEAPVPEQPSQTAPAPDSAPPLPPPPQNVAPPPPATAPVEPPSPAPEPAPPPAVTAPSAPVGSPQ